MQNRCAVGCCSNMSNVSYIKKAISLQLMHSREETRSDQDTSLNCSFLHFKIDFKHEPARQRLLHILQRKISLGFYSYKNRVCLRTIFIRLRLRKNPNTQHCWWLKFVCEGHDMDAYIKCEFYYLVSYL
jgi:hypothetical protein